jgi:hypothetical protein
MYTPRQLQRQEIHYAAQVRQLRQKNTILLRNFVPVWHKIPSCERVSSCLDSRIEFGASLADRTYVSSTVWSLLDTDSVCRSWLEF